MFPKIVEPKFAGAMEYGSKEAYSSIVQAKAMQTSNLQSRIAASSERTAGATEQSAAALSRMAQYYDANKGGGDQGRCLTAGN